MKTGSPPDPNALLPIPGYANEIHVKPAVRNPAIVVGEFTFIADADFKSHVTHLYGWNGDRLVIGRFCQIAAGVEFAMNGANHQMNSATTYPFYTLYTLAGWDRPVDEIQSLIPLLTSGDMEYLRRELRRRLTP